MRTSLVFLFFVAAIFLLPAEETAEVITGDRCISEYFPLIRNKKIAILSNQTGKVGEEHLVDFLAGKHFDIKLIFSPEHGFRGDADAGESVKNSIDRKTGIPIRSLYNGAGGLPSAITMASFDILVVDIQDVGLRFYTYYITMYKLMDACARYHKKMIVLDRPDPNGFYVDGPILDMKYRSGVGALPIPVVYGMTLGELAGMINGEKWLPGGRVCRLYVVKCRNYTHHTLYNLPIAPSPNLPDMRSVYLYPSLCFFEGTIVSLGRGTPFPFQVYGHPDMKGCDFSFTPESLPGAKDPPLKGERCYGVDLRNLPEKEIIKNGLDLHYLIDAYHNLNKGDAFFTPFFEKLVGVDYVRKMIEQGKSAEEIREKWKPDVDRFLKQRKPYLLYSE